MSERLLCPICNSCTSTVLSRVGEGRPCPYCGAPAALILEVSTLKAKNSDGKLIERLIELGTRVASLETENRKLIEFLSSVQNATDHAAKRLADPNDNGDDEWS
jgi:hypothetical protein